MKQRIQFFLRRFSFRTGIIILALCVPCYIISFAQMALPISAAAKGVLWFVFFGLAKTFIRKVIICEPPFEAVQLNIQYL